MSDVIKHTREHRAHCCDQGRPFRTLRCLGKLGTDGQCLCALLRGDARDTNKLIAIPHEPGLPGFLGVRFNCARPTALHPDVGFDDGKKTQSMNLPDRHPQRLVRHVATRADVGTRRRLLPKEGYDGHCCCAQMPRCSQRAAVRLPKGWFGAATTLKPSRRWAKAEFGLTIADINSSNAMIAAVLAQLFQSRTIRKPDTGLQAAKARAVR